MTAYYKGMKGMKWKNGDYVPDPEAFFQNIPRTTTTWNIQHPEAASASFAYSTSKDDAASAPSSSSSKERKVDAALTKRGSSESRQVDMFLTLMEVPYITDRSVIPQREIQLRTVSDPFVDPTKEKKKSSIKTMEIRHTNPVLPLTKELLFVERQEGVGMYSCPIDYINYLLSEPNLREDERAEIPVVVEAYEMLLWLMMDAYYQNAFPGTDRRYIEGERIDQSFIRKLFEDQQFWRTFLFPEVYSHKCPRCPDRAVKCPEDTGHTCSTQSCGMPTCLDAPYPDPRCKICGCNPLGERKANFYLMANGERHYKVGDNEVGWYHSELTGLLMPSSGMVFLCRKSAKVHICGPFCRGQLDNCHQEFTCPISGFFKQAYTPSTIPIVQRDVFRQIESHEEMEHNAGEDDRLLMVSMADLNFEMMVPKVTTQFTLSEALSVDDGGENELVVSVISNMLTDKKRKIKEDALIYIPPPPPSSSSQKKTRRPRDSPNNRKPKKLYNLKKEELFFLVTECMYNEDEYSKHFTATLKSRLHYYKEFSRKRVVKRTSNIFALESMFLTEMPDMEEMLLFSLFTEIWTPAFFRPLLERTRNHYRELVLDIYVKVVTTFYDSLGDKEIKHKNFIRYLMLCIMKTMTIRNAPYSFSTSMVHPDRVFALSAIKNKDNGFKFLEDLGFPKTYGGFHAIMK